MTGQSSISNDVEAGTSTNGDARIDHHSPTAKSDTSLHEYRIIFNATFSSDENTSISRMNRKMRLVREENIASFVSSPVHMLSCPFLADCTMA